MKAKDLIKILQEVDPESSVEFFSTYGFLRDDQRQSLTKNDIDTSIDGVVDINIPSDICEKIEENMIDMCEDNEVMRNAVESFFE